MDRRSFLQRLASVAASLAVAPAAIAELVQAWEARPIPAVLDDNVIGDLVRATLRDLGQVKWTDICGDPQRHVALSKLLKSKRISFNTESVAWTPTNSD